VPGDGHQFRFYQKCKIGKFEKIKTRIFRFFDGQIGKKTLWKKPRKKFAEDSRLKHMVRASRTTDYFCNSARVFASVSYCARLSNIITSLAPEHLSVFFRTALCPDEGALVL
jgi:hypothetical protein